MRYDTHLLLIFPIKKKFSGIKMIVIAIYDSQFVQYNNFQFFFFKMTVTCEMYQTTIILVP